MDKKGERMRESFPVWGSVTVCGSLCGLDELKCMG